MAVTFQDNQSLERLILSFKQGDRACFGQLYDMYAPALLGVITRIVKNPELSADCLQQAFNEIWNEKKSYNFQKERPFNWMMKIARNSALNFLKNGHNYFSGPGKTVPGVEFLTVERKDNLTGKEPDIPALLPVPRQNAILELIYIQGFTLAEAAGRLNIPVETAKLQFVIAIKHLKTRVSV
jgi:RNA polymerase sigma-70 factor (ECF subfamily)